MNETRKDGRYVLYRAFTEGSRGKTFDAVDKREGRAVVVKKMDVRGATSWKDVELAEREVAVLKSLRHEKLPAYFEHFEEEGALYLVMEKIEGESLGSLKRRGGQLSEEDVQRFFRDAEDVLRYLHGRTPAVIHRDLKPGNVIRKPDGTFAFVDFGAVRDKLKPSGGSTVVGTFGYMAPEQFQGRALPASDVYAIGATALTMLTGVEPEDLPHRGLAIDVRAALKGSRVKESLIRALEKMLEPDPDKRSATIPSLDARDAKKESAKPDRKRERDTKSERKSAAAERRARAKERRAESRERRRARRAERDHGRAFPWPIALIFSIGITIGMVAVSLALSFAVPLALRLLALLFVRESLRRAADETSKAATKAIRRMHAAQEWLHNPNQATKVRIQTDSVRISDDAKERMRVSEEEEEEKEEKKRKRA